MTMMAGAAAVALAKRLLDMGADTNITSFPMSVGTPETGTLPSGEQRPVGLGVIGLGAFGRFCLEAYATMPDIHVWMAGYRGA
jgi:hypothetical protein